MSSRGCAAILRVMSLLASPLDRHGIAAMRLTAQRLGTVRSASPADAVRWMLAIQAQDLPGAKWSLGLRTQGCTRADADAALDAGEVVRSWPLRGTLHLVAAEDIGWLLSLTDRAKSAARRLVAVRSGSRTRTSGALRRRFGLPSQVSVPCLVTSCSLGSGLPAFRRTARGATT